MESFRGQDFVTDIFQDLKNSTLNRKILTIPSTRLGIPPFELYVRDCWVKICDLISSSIQNNMSDFLVTGTQGIGKSMFSYYFMWRYMTSDDFKGFYWERQKGQIIYYTSTGVTRVIKECRYVGAYELIPHFVDLIETTYPTFIGPSYRVVFSSPNPDRYKELQKGSRSEGFLQPPWTLAEILEARSSIRQLRESFYEGHVRRLFDIYGRIPRFLFADNIFQCHIGLNEAIRSTGRAVIEGILDANLGSNDDAKFHMIIHMFPYDSEKFSFLGYRLLPASPYVLDELDRLDILKLDANNAAYRRWRQVPSEASYRWIYERFCKKLLPGRQHRLKLLKPRSKQKVELSSNLIRMGRSRQNVEESGNITHRIIYVGTLAMDPASQMIPESLQGWTPKPDIMYSGSKGTESWDAFMISNTSELLIFQYTITRQQTIEINGLQDLFKQLDGHYKSAGIVFVCPDFLRLRRTQNLVTTCGLKCSRIPRIIKKYNLDFVQYVLLLQFPTVPQH